VFRVSASEFVDMWRDNALSEGNKAAIYAAWGENFQAAYPTFGSTLTTTRSPTRAPTLQNNFLSGSLPSNLRSPPPVAPTPTPTQPPTPRCVPHNHSARIDQTFDVGMSCAARRGHQRLLPRRVACCPRGNRGPHAQATFCSVCSLLMHSRQLDLLRSYMRRRRVASLPEHRDCSSRSRRSGLS
jgi:hypothetical protein